MPEIGLFGSEGGAPTHGVPTLSFQLSLRDTALSAEMSKPQAQGFQPWEPSTQSDAP